MDHSTVSRSCWLALLLALSLCCTCVTFAQPADPALLGYWPFDDGSGDLATDQSGHGYDGELRGADWVKGRFGTALHFDGENATVSIPAPDGLDGAAALTVEAWVYWEKGGRYPNILTGGNWAPGGFLIFVCDNTCSFRLGKPGKGPMDPKTWAETSAGFGQFRPGQWYHLAATFSRPTLTTYLDGRPVGTATWDYPVGFAGDLTIGAWGDARSSHAGLIDEVKLYTRALSAAEVQASYASGAPAHAPLAPGETLFTRVPVPPTVPAVTLENALLRLQLDKRARVLALVDKATKRNYCPRSSVEFVTLRKAGRALHPSFCSYRGGVLSLVFGRSGVTAQVKVTARDRYFVLELLSVSDPEVDEAVLGSVALDRATRQSGSVAWATDEVFAAAVVPLNLQVEVALRGREQPQFVPRCQRRYGLVGARAAFVGGPTCALRSILQDVVRKEGLPYSPLGGPFARDAEENRGSYLFAVVSEANVEEWIALARRGGFAEVHLCPWWHTMGHYEPNPDLFPHGLAGLKEVVGKLHAAGLKVGMHTLSGCIQVNDTWVSPVPDKRLAKDAHFTLATPLAVGDTTVQTNERPEGLETFWSDMSTGNTIQIEDEIIAYTGLSTEPPYGFTGCKRGQWQTRPAAHASGTAADHLVASYCSYIPDETTPLVDELAACIARVYNTCGFDMIYFDGSEGMKTTHAVATMKRAIFSKLKGRVLVESSSGSWGAWPFHSRVGAWDHPTWGFNRFNDLHCASLATHTAGELLPGHMGWWVITGPNADHAGMFPEDMEYFAAKCLGWDHSSSLQGVAAGARPPNSRQDEYLTMLGRYERLRLARYFSPAVLQRLRTPGEQFRLSQAADGSWQLRPTDYAAQRITSLTDGTAAWTVHSRFPAQPLRLRIEALYACQPYSDASGVLVSDLKPETFTARSAAPGVKQELAPAPEPTPDGAPAACLTALNTNTERRGAWTKLALPFTPPLNLGKAGALGVWIYGDGKGELLNFQFNNSREDYTLWDDHYVDIDFTGWRYFELLLRERDAQRHQDYAWPYGGACEVGRTPLVRGRVGAFNLYANNLPPGQEIRCYVGPVRALPVVKVNLANPVVTVAGSRLVFPVTLESGQYLEYEGDGEAVVRDERGEVLSRVRPEGATPQLAAGDNALTFTCEGPAELRARARVTVVSQGAPLTGRNTGKTVDTSLLQREYDDPRTVTTLDGRQNEWALTCREGKGAAFAVTLAVEQATPAAGAPEAAAPLVLEPCEEAAGFADGPENRYAQYVYDGEHSNVAVKPGVTVTLERVAEPVKVGQGALRLQATSTRGDSAGWCARGRRFSPVLDLHAYARLACWVYGDGGGQSLKLQLRDVKGGWQDLVTPIDFSGWKRLEFALGDGGRLDLAHLEYLLVFFNGLPGGRTVSCVLDHLEVSRDTGAVRQPSFTVGKQVLSFPVTIAAGERLVYEGGPGLVYGRDGRLRTRCTPAGQPPALRPGSNRLRFSFEDKTTAEFRVRVQAVKLYP